MKDIIGAKSGRLTVKARVGKIGTVQLLLCECDCENHTEVIVRYPNFISGTTKSCGCLKSESSSKRRLKDLTGKTFGELYVIRRYSEIGGKKVFWLCLCSCGRLCVVQGSNLTTGNTTTCGCGKESFNEGIIIHYLREHKIHHEKEAKFSDLLAPSGRPLRFDFKIYTETGYFLLEYQGQQHFQCDDVLFGKFAREYSDEKKKEYCKNHNIELCEITYKENTIEKLEEILANHKIVYDDTVPSMQEPA